MYNLICFIIILKIIFSQNNKSSDIFNNSYNISNLDFHSKTDLINTKRSLLSNPQPIRIYIDFHYLEKQVENEVVSSENFEIYKYALNRAKKALEDLIEIDRDENINFASEIKSLFDQNEYEGFRKTNMNSDLLNGNFKEKVDLLILVRMPKEDLDNSEIEACNEKSRIIKTNNGRPIIGYIVINKNFKIEDIDDNRYKKELYSVIFLHQLTHILGFNKTILNGKVKFEKFGIERISSNNPITKTLISNDNLLAEAKKYFGLNEDIKGLEVEEFQSDICDEYIHWDSRILLGDYMTFLIYEEEQTISELTLTLLEITGFYKTNKYTGGLSRFGRNQNNIFLTKDCNDILTEGATNNTKRKSLFPNEFCASNTKTTCSSGRLSKGTCDNYETDMRKYTKYSRIQWENYGDEYADFCPISMSEIKQSENKYSLIGNCKFGERENYGHYAFYYWNPLKEDKDFTVFNESYGESFSNISFCAFSSVISAYDSQVNKEIYEGFVRPTCYEMYCSDESLTIKIDKLYHVCPRRGGIIEIEGDYEGHLVCPDYNLICSQTEPCNNLFDCIDKKSELKDNINQDPYDRSEDVSVQIVSTPIQGTFRKAYELSANGKCPKDCSKCNEFNQCLLCDSSKAQYYIGVRENDLNPITCNNTNPKEAGLPYYKKQESDKTYFFKCIDNCIECDEANKCKACAPQFNITKNNESCIVRINGCRDYNESSGYPDRLNNNGYEGYEFCEKCNDTEDYYCLNDEKHVCVKLNDDLLSYYNTTKGCLVKCEDKYDNCYSCNSTDCTQCKSGYYLNNNNECLVGIDHCDEHDLNTNPPECIKCEDNYSCLNGNRKICEKINDVDLYFLVNDTPKINDCRELCSSRYGEKCKNCTKDECKNCYDGYFVYDKEKCILSIKNCKKHHYDGTEKYCEECEEHYFCIDNKKDECQSIEQSEENYYIKIADSNNPICYEKCFKQYPFCLTCQDSVCIDCEKNTDKIDGKCIPNFVSGSCSIKITEEVTDIKAIDLAEFPMKYVRNANRNSNFIDHYINKDYTVTVFINSECTEDLLNQGYYKIDSKELQNAIKTKDDDIIYTVFITHNFKSYMGYYDNELKNLDVSVDISSKIDYTITNKYIRSINEALGPLVASLVESEKIDIFGRDSDVYNNYCQNITILGIDIPLKRRLLSLYPHSFREQLACLGEDCVIDEFNFDESTCSCKCKMGNKFEDILETNFTHYEGPFEEYNNFIDSIGIIKCTKNGFSPKNMMANPGFFLILIGIILQIILYLYYYICSDPITNIYKGTNNPPKKTIMLYSDWDKRLNKNNRPEGEVFIQPRDDADEQLLEEEKTYSNDDDFNTSNISIDTNVGDIKKKNGEKGKLSEKPDKRVLILLKNKSGKNQKSKKDLEDLKSDSEILNLKEEVDIDKISFCQIYWSVVSLKQHIINYFSFMHCCKITKSYIPLSMRLIRSIFLVFLSFVFNILFLNQGYYEKKFIHFNENYKLIHAESPDLIVKTGDKIGYAISHTFVYAMVSLILLIIVNFIVGIIFFSIRNSVGEIIKNNKISDIDDLTSKVKRKNMIFIIIDLILMAIFLLTIVAFVGAYGGGFIDYFIAGIISLIFLELIPFLWSLVIALFMYLGIKNKNKCCSSFSKFFMF